MACLAQQAWRTAGSPDFLSSGITCRTGGPCSPLTCPGDSPLSLMGPRPSPQQDRAPCEGRYAHPPTTLILFSPWSLTPDLRQQVGGRVLGVTSSGRSRTYRVTILNHFHPQEQRLLSNPGNRWGFLETHSLRSAVGVWGSVAQGRCPGSAFSVVLQSTAAAAACPLLCRISLPLVYVLSYLLLSPSEA